MTKSQRHAQKLQIGWQVAERDGCMSDFADALGVSRPAVTQFLRMYPDLRKALSDGRHKSILSDQETAERALMAAQCRLGWMLWTVAARAFGITSNTLHGWARRHDDEVREVIYELTSARRAAA